MSIHNTHDTNVLKFWRAVEVFNLPDVPAFKRGDRRVFTVLSEEEPLPWESGRYAGTRGKRWKHTLYFHLVPKQEVIDLLTRLAPLPSDNKGEPLTGYTCLAALVVDESGQPAERTYVRAAFVYGLKILSEGGDLDEINELLKKAYSEYLLRFQVVPEKNEQPVTDEADNPEEMEEEEDIDEEYPEEEEEEELDEPEENEPLHEGDPSYVTWSELNKETEDLARLMGGMLSCDHPILCISEEIYEQAPLEVPFLNSFYMNDLNYLISHPKERGTPLAVYLAERIHKDKRWDLLNPGVMFDCIDPQLQTPGRWPANPAHGLHSAQLAALHIAIPSLKAADGLLGINGPPGTGKTTLLREVIVDVIVNRAMRLLETDIQGLFSTRYNKVAEYVGYYAPEDDLFGDGILVASNNNAAVENISKELPLWKNIDAETFGGARYFKETACALAGGQPCWGLLSAVLGNSRNRNYFKDKFWFNGGKGFEAYLQEQLRAPAGKVEHMQRYEAAADQLRSLLETYNLFRRQASEYHQLLRARLSGKRLGARKVKKFEELAAVLQNKYGIAPKDLPDENFLNLPMEAIHKVIPYSSSAINILRSDIFLASLELHACAIRVHAKYFRANLNAFVNMLSGRQADLMDEKVTAALWDTFFFCIPLVSTTLASVERLFAKSGRGSIGWLLLDEAGQATPQSACGAIWRCRRCVIIGDTLQVPPIVTMPPGLGRSLGENYDLEDLCWQPSDHSAQFLADRVTYIGTYVETMGEQMWTGIPLRAHRRCNEPMFSVSNTIAYNGKMVKVAPDAASDIPLESCWFDVRGVKSGKGNILQEEIKVLTDLIHELSFFRQMEALYVISPFRSVSDHVTELYRDNKKIACGTIHTFQGKESDTVFLVLGTHPQNVQARQWASSIPNMLNVAVTRAKKRLYVIGNREVWKTHSYYDTLAKMLPVKGYEKGIMSQKSSMRSHREK